MAKTIEKLIKIEQPRKILEMKLNPMEAFSAIPKLDLMNIESYTEPGITIHVDLDLDQIEEE